MDWEETLTALMDLQGRRVQLEAHSQDGQGFPPLSVVGVLAQSPTLDFDSTPVGGTVDDIVALLVRNPQNGELNGTLMLSRTQFDHADSVFGGRTLFITLNNGMTLKIQAPEIVDAAS